MVSKAAPPPMKWVVPGRRSAPAAPPPKRPRVRLAVVACALALGLALLALVLSRSPEEGFEPSGTRAPAAPVRHDAQVYESENVRIEFKREPAPADENAAEEAAEESP